MESLSTWFESFKKPGATITAQLLCFHHLGSNSRFSATWNNALPAHIEVLSLKLPGREKRMAEQPETNMDQLITRLVTACKPALTKPYAVLGNSMGCWIGYEFIVRMQKEGGLVPVHFFPCAAGPPHKKTSSFDKLGTTWDKANEGQIVNYLKAIGGSDELIQHKELLEFFIPIFRADGMLTESYLAKREARGEHEKDTPIDANISFFGAHGDSVVKEPEAWADLTTKQFALQMNHDTHLFLMTKTAGKDEVMAKIKEVLQDYI